MKILYFVKAHATEAQAKQAKQVGAIIRNALACHDGDFIEACDFVTGDVPNLYSHIPIYETEKPKQPKKPKRAK